MALNTILICDGLYCLVWGLKKIAFNNNNNVSIYMAHISSLGLVKSLQVPYFWSDTFLACFTDHKGAAYIIGGN